MSNKVLLKKSSVPSKVPTTSDLDYGELALNYADGKLYYKTANNTISSISGSGGGGGGGNYTQIDRQSYTATSGQTTFSIAYVVPYVDVYVNGAHLGPQDYTATSGNDIVLSQASVAGDQLDLVGFSGEIVTTSTKSDGDLLVYNGTTGVWDNVSQTSITSGNADKWTTSRTLSYTGDATGSMSVDGSAAVSTALTLATVNSNVGTYNSVTVNAKGLVTSASNTTYALPIDTLYIGTTSVALNRASANLALTGISSVTLPGAVSGSVQIIPAAAVGTGTVLTIPATTGTIITSGDSGTVTSTMIADGTIVNADINASAAIAVSKLAASTISGITLGNNLNALTIGTGLSGTSYNGSSAVTIAIDSTVATLTGTQTLSNKSLNAFDQKTGSTSIANQAVVQATVTTTTATAVDTFAAATYRSAKYVIQVTQGSNYQVSEMMVIHNGTTTSTTEYAMMNTNGVLGTFTTDISGGNVRLLVTMSSATSTTINIARTAIVV